MYCYEVILIEKEGEDFANSEYEKFKEFEDYVIKNAKCISSKTNVEGTYSFIKQDKLFFMDETKITFDKGEDMFYICLKWNQFIKI